MEIVLHNAKSKYLEIFTLRDPDIKNETFKKFTFLKELK